MATRTEAVQAAIDALEHELRGACDAKRLEAITEALRTLTPQ